MERRDLPRAYGASWRKKIVWSPYLRHGVVWGYGLWIRIHIYAAFQLLEAVLLLLITHVTWYIYDMTWRDGVAMMINEIMTPPRRRKREERRETSGRLPIVRRKTRDQ